MVINSETDWWNGVEKYWPQLLAIMAKYLPLDGHEDLDKKVLVEPLYVAVERLKHYKDKELVRYFNAAWRAAPDHPSIHQNYGWGVLCDLCSEDHVLYENEIP